MNTHLIKELRMKKGLSQKELALLANMDQSNLCRIEKGNHVPKLAVLERIAKALGVSVRYFF